MFPLKITNIKERRIYDLKRAMTMSGKREDQWQCKAELKAQKNSVKSVQFRGRS